MTDSTSPTPARIRKTHTFASIVWLIPLLALLVGGWLLMNNIRNTGPEITLYMVSAEGIEVNNTVIRVLNVEMGRITKIRLNPDRKGVELTARLTADAKDMMRKDTQFWIVKPRIDQSGISGLNTLVSGSYIAFTPGVDAEEQYQFTVSDLPPIAAIGQSGIRLQLSGDNNKMLDVGSPVMYESFTVGQIESAKFDPKTRRVHYTVFIKSPNDKLINTDSQFWLQSGVHIQTDGSGVQIEANLPTLLSGAIAFRTPVIHNENNGTRLAVNNDVFELYNDRTAIDNLPSDRSLYYVAFFKQSVRGLMAGAPVEYKGIPVGSVANVPYFAEGDALKLFQNGWIPVRIRIEPHLIEQSSTPKSKEYWQDTLQHALNQGLNATLSSNNLVLGSKMIELTDAPSDGARLKPFTDYHGDTVIATRGGGLDDLQAQLSQLLDKFNKLPLDKTVGELNNSLSELKATLHSVNKLVKQPTTQRIPAELNQTLRELRRTLQGISPQSPVYRDVQNTLNSIDQTLRDAQPVLNTLKEKPNALIFNQNSRDPIPKGSQ